MAKGILPTAHALRSYGLKHEVDPRTILRALQDQPIHGEAASRKAKAAAAEWREEHGEHGRLKTKTKAPTKRARAK
jgi:hypothetical protein